MIYVNRLPTDTPHLVLRTSAGRQEALMEATGGRWLDANGWVHGPGFAHAPIPEAETQLPLRPVLAIVHSNAAPKRTAWEALIAYWRRSDITGEATFQVQGVAGPAIAIQALPVNVKADCNYKANAWFRGTERVGAISFECQDNGAASLPTTPLSLGQLDLIAAAIVCTSAAWPISCAPAGRWNDDGTDYHSKFPEWSSYTGKTCPGAARIRQMDGLRGLVADRMAKLSELSGWQCGKGWA